MEGYPYSSGLATPRHIQAALMRLSGSAEHKLGREIWKHWGEVAMGGVGGYDYATLYMCMKFSKNTFEINF